MSIIGQDKILNIIHSYKGNCPQSICLVGKYGSGKHLITQYLADFIGVSLVDITEKLDLETINDIYLSVTPHLYLIDGTKISDKSQNVILKFIEEPPQTAYIVIICETISQMLPTIINRCQVLFLENYNRQYIAQFSKNDFIIKIAQTPGQAIEMENLLSSILLKDIFDFIDHIIDKIAVANVANILSIPNKLSFDKKDKSKIDIDIFIDILLYCLQNRIISNEDSKYIKAYKLTSQLKNDTYINHINKQKLFENYLLKLKYTLKNGN